MQTATRVRELLEEARRELNRYDSLRANTLSIIATYEQRMKILGEDVASTPLPGVEQYMSRNDSKSKSQPTNMAVFHRILTAQPNVLSARDICTFAQQSGWRTDSSNPIRVVESTLRKMVNAGQIELASPGRFRAKESEEQATT